MLDVNKVKERILSIISYEGPLLPIQISRKLEKDTIFAGAVLSELLKEKAIRVSNAKIGSSPLYYMAGQESKLSLLYNHLPLKESDMNYTDLLITLKEFNCAGILICESPNIEQDALLLKKYYHEL